MADDGFDRLCRHFALDSEAARGAMSDPAGHANPWYLRVTVAIGAWVTAAAMILAVGTVLAEALPSDNLAMAAAVFGAGIAVAAIALHHGRRGAFAGQCAVAAALAGQAMLVVGLAAEAESLTLAATIAAISTAVLAVLLRDGELLFLSSAFTVVLAFAALLEHDTPQAGGMLLAVTLPPALALLLRPPAALDLRGLAFALLLVPLAALAIPDMGGLYGGPDPYEGDWLSGDWLARAAYALALVAALALLARGAAGRQRRTIAAAGVVALLVGAVTAAGVLGSLLLLTLAYLLGSRLLATVGVIAHVGFVAWFYYDLQLDLLEKSVMLAAAGLLLLALWWVWSRRPSETVGVVADA